MKSYAQRYEEFTAATVKLAEQIHSANREKVMNAKYTLPQITAALRNIYKDPIFHEKFVSSKMSENKWSSGFCAMASVLIYEMYGGDDVWEMMAIRQKDWPRSPVIFLRDKATGINFGTTGEHFYTEMIAYEIGRPVDTTKLKTPHKETFKNVLMFELARLNKNSKK